MTKKKDIRKRENYPRRNKSDIVDTEKKGLRNKETNVIAFFFVGLFALIIAYLIIFNVKDGKRILNNQYNKRVDNQADKVVRGNILSSDGTVLATTKVNEEGEEYRYYPYENVFCHTVGFTSSKLKSGVEQSENYYLLSETDNIFDQISNDLSGEKAKGHNVKTTLDVNLSKTAYSALGDNKGAVIVMEPSTGKILCMVSSPSFDPNEAEENYLDWIKFDSNDSVLLNRATQGLYPPGSTFKILTTLEYMRENKNYNSYSYDCEGQAYINGGTTIKCFDSTEHGEESLKNAFANSCNGAYSTIGTNLNKKNFASLCNKFKFNSDLDLAFDCSKNQMLVDDKSSISEMQETGIGQGKTMISPIHNLMITSTIANKGVMMKPYLVDNISDAYGRIVKTYNPERLDSICSQEEVDYLSECMREVATSGTGYAFRYSEYNPAGKTGSAQFDNVSDDYHSWFVGYAPFDNPQVSICVILEGGYKNVASAQYVAKTVLDAYFGY